MDNPGIDTDAIFKTILRANKRGMAPSDVVVEGDNGASRIVATDREHLIHRSLCAPEVAFITENVDFYSGGRYHGWLQAHMLNELGYKVVVFTNRDPVFLDDFDCYKPLEIVHVQHLERLDVVADAYYGTPVVGTMAACKLGLKHDKPVYTLMFDPPTWMEQSDVVTPEELNRHYVLRGWLDKHLGDLPDFKLIANTSNAIPEYIDWYGLPPENVTSMHPPINSRVLRRFHTSKAPRKQIVSISRNNVRKGWKEVFEAYAPYSDDHELHVITNSKTGMIESAYKYGINADQIKIHISPSDVEKFYIMSQSQALITASHFEGFGMMQTEGRAFGMPVVCYDLKPFEDIYPEDDYILKANCFDVEDLSEKLGQALSMPKSQPATDHDIDGPLSQQMIQLVRTPILPEGSISALYIVLNEEEFLEQSLTSVLKRPEVAEAIIIEGADTKYPNASKNGLSTDRTPEIIEFLQGKYPKKIKYIKHGWAEGGKAELRQGCIDEAGGTDWYLFVDGDEVWEDAEWRGLIRGIRDNPDCGVIYFKHYHFWKDLRTIAVGGQWECNLMRLFRNTGEKLGLGFHAGEPLVDGVRLGEKYGTAKLDDVYVHHYGYMKSEGSVKDKLEYYSKRDTELDVKDTYSGKQNKEGINPTHGNGKAVSFDGKHPYEIKHHEV